MSWFSFWSSLNDNCLTKYYSSLSTIVVIKLLLYKDNNYNIDGIHLDYIRYQDEYYGFHRDGRKEFDLLFDIDPLDISRGVISTRYGWELSYVDSIYIEWNRFKQGKVTELLEFINPSSNSNLVCPWASLIEKLGGITFPLKKSTNSFLAKLEVS